MPKSNLVHARARVTVTLEVDAGVWPIPTTVAHVTAGAKKSVEERLQQALSGHGFRVVKDARTVVLVTGAPQNLCGEGNQHGRS